MEQLIHNIEDSTSVEQWEKILESEVPLKIKKTSIIKNKIKRVEKELDAIQKKKQETEKSIAKLEQKITEKNIQAISEDDIKNILEGTADQAVPISAEELYGKSLSAAIKKSPCDWLKLPESDALVIRPNNKKELSRFILVDGENQSPKKKCESTFCFSPLILPEQIQTGLETMYADMLGKLGFPQGGRAHAKRFVEQICNNELKNDGSYHMYEEHLGKYGHIGGCDKFCHRFAAKIEPLLATQYKPLYDEKAKLVAAYDDLIKDFKKQEETKIECEKNENEDTVDVDEKLKILKEYVQNKKIEKTIENRKEELRKKRDIMEKSNTELQNTLKDLPQKIISIINLEKENEGNKEKRIQIESNIEKHIEKIKKIDQIVTETTDKVEKLAGLGGILDDIYRTAGEAAQQMTKVFRKKMSDIQLWLTETPVPDLDITGYEDTDICDEADIELLRRCPWWIGDNDMTSHILVSPLEAVILATTPANIEALDMNTKLTQNAPKIDISKDRQNLIQMGDKLAKSYQSKLKESMSGLDLQGVLKTYALDTEKLHSMGRSFPRFIKREGAVDICKTSRNDQVSSNTAMEPLQSQIKRLASTTKSEMQKLTIKQLTVGEDPDPESTQDQLDDFEKLFENKAGLTTCFEFFTWAKQWKTDAIFHKLMMVMNAALTKEKTSEQTHSAESSELTKQVAEQMKQKQELEASFHDLEISSEELDNLKTDTMTKLQNVIVSMETIDQQIKEMDVSHEDIKKALKGAILLQSVGEDKLYKALDQNLHRLSKRTVQAIFLEKDAHKLTHMVKESLAQI